MHEKKKHRVIMSEDEGEESSNERGTQNNFTQVTKASKAIMEQLEGN